MHDFFNLMHINCFPNGQDFYVTLLLTLRFDSLTNFDNYYRYGGRHTVTMMPGSGIGPEMMGYVRETFNAAGAPVDFEIVHLDSDTDNYADLHNVSM